MKTFQPPIQDRQTSALIKIVAIPENWDAEAAEQAEIELLKRGVEFKELAKREKYLHSQREKLDELRRAKESYSICDFLESPIFFMIEILVSWELKKDGYLRKARQQKTIRIIILGIASIIYLYTFINDL